ncbi:MAG: DUF3313 domain-containing protein [Gammaproteobacteria bacterium]|nr:DUF3313 domain-containing protein [Gammaproteobacteria bacterium]
MNWLKTLFIVLVLLATMPGFLFAAAPSLSDFIDGDVKLEKCPKRHGSYCYIKPGIQLAKYNKVLFTPIEFRLHPQSEYRGVAPDDYKLVSDMFHQTLIGQLEPAYPVVTNSDASTLAVRIALVDIKLKKKSRTLMGWTPVGLIAGTAQDKVSKKLKLLDAVLEAEFVDAATGERLAVLVDQNLYEDGSNTESWESMRLMFKHYAKRIKARLDEAHKK